MWVGTGDNDGTKDGTRDSAIDGSSEGSGDAMDGSEDISELGWFVGATDGNVPQSAHVLGQCCQRSLSVHLFIVRSGYLAAHQHQGLFFVPMINRPSRSVQMLGALEEDGTTEGSRIGGSDCPSEGRAEGSRVGGSDCPNDGGTEGSRVGVSGGAVGGLLGADDGSSGQD